MLRDFRGIIHCHSLYSHDSRGTYEEILAAAKAAKVDFICMTDHPPKGDPGLSLREGWKGLHDGVLFIQGAEYSDNILGLGLTEPIQFKDRRGTIRAIHEQGGVAFACHPEGIKDWSEFEDADGMEVYNVHATVMKHKNDAAFVAKVIKMLKEDPEHSFRLLQELDPAILAKWDEINRGRRFAGIAGNDAHQNVQFFGAQLDPYPRAFRFVATHVWAEDLTQESVLRALKLGRCYVEFEGGVGSPADREETFDYQVLWTLEGSVLLAHVLPGARPVRHLRLIHNGKEVAAGESDGLLLHALTKTGAYRVEFGAAPDVPLVLSNPVVFRSGLR